MAQKERPFDVSKELAALKHEKKNQKMKTLPPGSTVQRRPLHHPPVASPFADADVQKVVYVSSHTPVISAVKKVRKLLSRIENRAHQSVDAKGKQSSRFLADLADASDQLAKAREEVLVKASGRAMSQALRVGEWFRKNQTEMMVNVEVRTSSVRAVDDIVDADESQDLDETDGNDHEDREIQKTTILEGGETTMELLGGEAEPAQGVSSGNVPSSADIESTAQSSEIVRGKKRRRVKRKRAMYEEGDVPEARIRWVKTVEVAISFKA